ncbi:glycoside hydrolase family 5 protein [Neorhizobium galegae]|uniref:glycoside hydrolase family 5 protein n=1 Tax=Neorhizobium galegae TaxID=399 RepID=UPI00062229A7|nr:glycoside hydrolase family 5 protein [Neorhizobium galegae]CDZ25872.1 Endoglucanase [Neorhizobium galegae bv. officinalis]KAA9388475.1 glycoside hydrolase family 5 protein [Neorhizobium galegae]KAB1114798.1 glycoside hydrolase family 5 protein [Neorhizobium galegae]MCM2497076.1 glycoside hydrolase family 5 protein [Neorhizobium galegae]MCQ1771144.1 glycoside hydrolase family 5 protein [Neorhizobium galegae]
MLGLFCRLAGSLVLMALGIAGAQAQNFVLKPFSEARAPELAGLTAAAQSKALGRGVNFGGTLEAPSEGAWGGRLSTELFTAVRQGGFQTIRLPVRFSSHAAISEPYKLDEAFMRRVDFAINNALSRGLNIIIDFHHYHEMDGDALEAEEVAIGVEKSRERFLAIWEQLARRYQSLPNDKVLFEIYNEPHGKTEEVWNELLGKALAVIRKTNPHRFLIVDPAEWSTAWGLKKLAIPADDRRLIVTIHNYAPFKFTMQGASWIEGSRPWLGTSCCENVQIEEIRTPLDMAVEWGKKNDRPIFVGEFGSNSLAYYPDRVTYTRIMREEIERRGMSWAYWDFASHEFGPWDPTTKSWLPELHEALVPKK